MEDGGFLCPYVERLFVCLIHYGPISYNDVCSWTSLALGLRPSKSCPPNGYQLTIIKEIRAKFIVSSETIRLPTTPKIQDFYVNPFLDVSVRLLDLCIPQSALGRSQY